MCGVCVCVCVHAGESQAAWEIMILYDGTARQKKPHILYRHKDTRETLHFCGLGSGNIFPIHFLNGNKIRNKDSTK